MSSSKKTLSDLLRDIRATYQRNYPAETKRLIQLIKTAPELRQRLESALQEGLLDKVVIDVDKSILENGEAAHFNPRTKTIVLPLAVLQQRHNDDKIIGTFAHELLHSHESENAKKAEEAFHKNVALIIEQPSPRDYTKVVDEYLKTMRLEEAQAEIVGFNAGFSYAKQKNPKLTPLAFVLSEQGSDFRYLLDESNPTRFKPGIEFFQQSLILHTDENLELFATHFFDASNGLGAAKADYRHHYVSSIIAYIAEAELAASGLKVQGKDNYPQINMQALGLDQRLLQANGILDKTEDGDRRFLMVDVSDEKAPATMYFYEGNEPPKGALRKTQGLPGDSDVELDHRPTRIRELSIQEIKIANSDDLYKKFNLVYDDISPELVAQLKNMLDGHPGLKQTLGSYAKAGSVDGLGVAAGLFKQLGIENEKITDLSSTEKMVDIPYDSAGQMNPCRLLFNAAWRHHSSQAEQKFVPIDKKFDQDVAAIAKHSGNRDYTNVVAKYQDVFATETAKIVIKAWNDCWKAYCADTPNPSQADFLKRLTNTNQPGSLESLLLDPQTKQLSRGIQFNAQGMIVASETTLNALKENYKHNINYEFSERHGKTITGEHVATARIFNKIYQSELAHASKHQPGNLPIVNIEKLGLDKAQLMTLGVERSQEQPHFKFIDQSKKLLPKIIDYHDAEVKQEPDVKQNSDIKQDSQPPTQSPALAPNSSMSPELMSKTNAVLSALPQTDSFNVLDQVLAEVLQRSTAPAAAEVANFGRGGVQG